MTNTGESGTGWDCATAAVVSVKKSNKRVIRHEEMGSDFLSCDGERITLVVERATELRRVQSFPARPVAIETVHVRMQAKAHTGKKNCVSLGF